MSHRPVDIVVADDNAVLLNVLSETLEECGYSVRSAVGGLEALTEIRRRAPDILLSDLNMPRMSGFELLSIVRRRHPKIKVIAMSASYPRGVVPQGVAADAFYEKDATSSRPAPANRECNEKRTRLTIVASLEPRMDPQAINSAKAGVACRLLAQNA